MKPNGLEEMLAAVAELDVTDPEVSNLRACVQSIYGRRPVACDLGVALETMRPWPTRKRQALFGLLMFLEELSRNYVARA
jgi:hypothetical protein